MMLLLLLLAGVGEVYAQDPPPPNGQEITNQASGSFTNPDGSGGDLTIVSNEVVVVVVSQPEFSLEPNIVRRRFRGTSLELTHFLRNNGNVAATFDIEVFNVNDDDFDLQNLFWTRQNLDGEPIDPLQAASNGPVNLDTLRTVVRLEPGQEFEFAYNADISSEEERRRITSVLSINSIAREFDLSLSNVDSISVLIGTELDLQKEQIGAEDLEQGDTFSYRITGRNIGDFSALPTDITVDGNNQRQVILVDSIPVNTKFQGFGDLSKGTPLYHVPGMGALDFTSVPPTDIETVDLIAVSYDSIQVNEEFVVNFGVKVNDNATGTLTNTAQVTYVDPEGDVTTAAASNEVTAELPEFDATIDYFTDQDFDKTTGTSSVGAPLHLEASASACNASASDIDMATITLVSLTTGDTEVFQSMETGPNTGRFRIGEPVPTRDGSVFDVVHGNGILETVENDEIEATLECTGLDGGGGGPGGGGGGGARIIATVVVDPFGIIFDSETGVPVAGAEVRLIDVTTGQLAEIFAIDGVTPRDNIQTTDANGEFRFPFMNNSRFRVEVVPPRGYVYPSEYPINLLPAERSVDPEVSFGREFTFPNATDGIDNDIPLDPQSTGVLFVEKTVDRKTAEIGDFINYSISIRSAAVNTVQRLRIDDMLPFGFEYQPGTARLDGVQIADPEGGKGPNLTFQVGDIATGATLTLTYRVFVGPGAERGDGTNVAVATSDEVIVKTSNFARVKIDVRGGVFADEGIIVGKVFKDCNENDVQDPGEVGIPGVRIYLENGNYVITDGEGRYTFFGIQPNKHVAKIDNYSLPQGSRLTVLDNRHAFDPSSRFVDLKKGEIHRADFAVCNCTTEVEDEIAARREAYSSTLDNELGSTVTRNFSLQDQRGARGQYDQASGTIGNTKTPEVEIATAPGVATPDSAIIDTAGLENQLSELEAALLLAEPGAGFLNYVDGDTLAINQTTLWAKGRAGAKFKLYINGEEIDEKKIGRRSVSAEKQIQAWEFVSIDFEAGANNVRLEELDPFGNVRGQHDIVIYAPGDLKTVQVTVPVNDVSADGTTTAVVRVDLLDETGIKVGSRLPVTLDVSLGEWKVEDSNPSEPGTQVFIEGGSREFELQSTIEPKTVKVLASVGIIEGEAKVNFLPDLRPLIAAGILEGTIRLRDPLNISPSVEDDGFERELTALSYDINNFTADGRLAFFLKGKVSGRTLLTAGFDSEKEKEDRLFRDIRPDEFYPIYGESSVKGFDAQASTRLYVRLDRGKTYALYGDFITQDRVQERQLGDYSRNQTGIKTHLEEGKVKANAFASSAFSTRRVQDIRAQGISRYDLNEQDIVENSEVIELVVFDRNQPDVIVSVERLTRFRDYVLESFTGVITFRTPISSVDADLNPRFIRAAYEVDNDDKKYLVGGVDATVEVAKGVNVGGSFVKDNNPDDEFSLTAGNVSVDLSKKTKIVGEVASTNTDSRGQGSAARVEIQHRGKKVDFNAQVGKSDRDFNNQTATLGQGRTEARARGRVKLNGSTNVNGEVLFSRNDTTGAETFGGVVNVQQSVAKNVNAEVGVRHTQQSGGTNDVTNTNIRSKVTADIGFLRGASTYAEYEQDLNDSQRKLFGIGGDYKFKNRTKLYARHEFISSTAGRFTLNNNAQRNNTVVGLDAGFLKNGRVYSEYRLNDALDGRSGQAAIGLRNQFPIREGFSVNFGFERIFTVEGPSGNDGTSISTGIDYTASARWKGTARGEARFGANGDTYINSVGYGLKLSNEWSLLAKNIISLNTRNGVSGFSRVQQRLRLGTAYRDINTNRFDALFRYELRYEKDVNIDPQHYRIAHVVSTQGNFHPSQDWTFSGRIAAKKSVENDALVKSESFLELISGRAIYDINRSWDASVNASLLANSTFTTRDYGVGVELGFLVATNLRLATGYNFFGYSDEDLATNNYTQQGVYAGFSYKFDEQIFKSLAPRRSKKFIDESLYLTCKEECAPDTLFVPIPILPFTIADGSLGIDPADLAPAPFEYKPLDRWFILPKQIHFDNDKTYINPAAAQMLNKLAKFLALRDNYSIKVTGHTDSKSSYAYNLALSERRARAVRAYLVAAGINPRKLQFEGLSYDKNAAEEQDRVDMALNRRVELELSVDSDNVRFIDQVEDVQVNKEIRNIGDWDYIYTPEHNAVPSAFNLSSPTLNGVHEYFLDRIALALTEYAETAVKFEVPTRALGSMITDQLVARGIEADRVSYELGNNDSDDLTVNISYTNENALFIYEQTDDIKFASNREALGMMENLLEILKTREDYELLRDYSRTYTVPDHISFLANDVELGNETQAVLSRIGSYLRNLPDVTIRLVHSGSDTNKKRVQAIRDYMIEWGVDGAKIEVMIDTDASSNRIDIEYMNADLINLLEETIDSGTPGK